MESDAHHPPPAFTEDNTENMRLAIGRHKNILVCGVQGVGKITHTVGALLDRQNLYYIGNPVDYEGRLRPGSYEKYLHYIHALKTDIKIIGHIEGLFSISEPVVVIVDEIYGRPPEELEAIGRLLDMPNAQVIQIVGCLKYMGELIRKFDLVIELHHNAAYSIDRDLALAICTVLGKKGEKLF